MDKKIRNITIILLAAGHGKRIAKYSKNPKCLLKIGQKSILERNFDIWKSLGLKKIFIVMGYKKKLLENKLKKYKKNFKIKKILNNKFVTHGNCYSLYLALKKVKGDAIFFDGDLIYNHKILKHFLNYKKKDSILVGPGNINDIECAKVLVDKKIVKRIIEKRKISKKERKYTFAGEALGINKISYNKIKKFTEILSIEFKKKKNLDLNWDTAYDKFLIKKHKTDCYYTKSKKWIEIDTVKDIKTARKMIDVNLL